MRCKKVLLFHVIFIITFIISACIEEENPDLTWWNADIERISTISYDSTLIKNTSNIPLTSLSIDEPISQPYMLNFGENFLFFLEKEYKPFIRVFDLRKKEFTNSFGSFGKGPGEFQSISSPFISCASSTSNNRVRDYSNCHLFVYDMFLQRITKIQLPSLLKKTNPNFSTLKIKSDDGIIFGLVPQDSNYVGTGVFYSNRLQFFDPKGKFLSKSGNIPTDGSNSLSQIRSQAYINDIFYDDIHDRIFLINHNTDKIEIYTNDEKQSLIISGPDFFEPHYSVSKNRPSPMMGSSGDMRFSNIDLCFDKQHFYILYSGQSRAQAHSNSRQSRTGNKILKFSYNGKLQEATILPFFASAMGCNSDNDKISLLENNLSPKLYLIAKEKFK